MVDLHIPGLPVNRLVVEEDELICFFTGWDNFTVGLSIVERGDAASFHRQGKLLILKLEDSGGDLLDRDGSFGRY